MKQIERFLILRPSIGPCRAALLCWNVSVRQAEVGSQQQMRRSREEITSLLEDYERSGKTQRQGLALGSFQAWLRRRRTGKRKSVNSSLMEVELGGRRTGWLAQSESGGALEVLLPNGYRNRVRAVFSKASSGNWLADIFFDVAGVVCSKCSRGVPNHVSSGLRSHQTSLFPI
jgi:hypothetical protein